MSAEPQITRATPDDLPGTLALLRANNLPTDGVDQCVETTVVARRHGRIVGSAALESYHPYALLRSVAVDATLRGQGLGAALVERAVEMARDRGVRAIYLLTETAPAFFAKLGFVALPRSAVAEPVTRSAEFTLLCSDGAQAMRRVLADG